MPRSILVVLGLLACGPLDTRSEPIVADRLPEGAIARLGTSRLRSTATAMNLAPDGKSLLTLSGGRVLAVRDLTRGRLLREHELPGSPTNEPCTFSPDGTLVVVVELKKIEIWTTTTKKKLHSFPTGAEYARISRDSKTLVTCHYSKGVDRLRMWDLATGQSRVFAKLLSSPTDVRFSHDGKRLFLALANSSVQCWDVEAGRRLWKNDHVPRHLDLSPDGRTLVAGHWRLGPVALLEARTGKKIADLGDKANGVTQVAFSPDGRLVAEATRNKGIFLWDIKTRKLRHHFSNAGSRVVFAPDGKSLISLGPVLERWDVRTGEPLFEQTRQLGHVGLVTGLRFSPDGTTLASSGRDRTIRFWDLTTKRGRILLRDAPSERSAIFGQGSYPMALPLPMEFTPDGKSLLTESDRTSLQLFSVSDGTPQRRFSLPHRKGDTVFVLRARITPDAKTLLALGEATLNIASIGSRTTRTTQLAQWNLETGKRKNAEATVTTAWGIGDVSPDGRLMALSGGGRLHSTSDNRNLPLENRGTMGPPFRFSSDSRFLAGTKPGNFSATPQTVVVFESSTGQRLAQIETRLPFCSDLRLGPNGRFVAALGPDSLHIWQCSTGKQVLRLSAKNRIPNQLPNAFARCLAISPDGNVLATGHSDGSILLWDLSGMRTQLALPEEKLDPKQGWADLSKGARTAHSAIEKLVTTPKQTVAMLKDRLSPLTIDRPWLARQFRLLDSDSFDEREAATKALETVKGKVENEIRQQLAKTNSAEVKKRLQKLLESPTGIVPDGNDLRTLRAILVLERIASPEALTLLRQLAAGEKSARSTQEAAASLARLKHRKAKP